MLSPVASGFLPRVLGRIQTPETGLAIWWRCTRLNLRVAALTLLSRPSFTVVATGSPDAAPRELCRELLLFHWPLYADFRRLAHRLAGLTGSPNVRMRFEHVVDDSCCKLHVDAVGLRLLCTYAGAGTEWVDDAGRVRRLATMEVGVFKGSVFPGAGPRVLHRSPPLSTGNLGRRQQAGIGRARHGGEGLQPVPVGPIVDDGRRAQQRHGEAVPEVAGIGEQARRERGIRK
jgi:hypothetical protein